MSILKVNIAIVSLFFFLFLTPWFLKLRFVSNIFGPKFPKAAIVSCCYSTELSWERKGLKLRDSKAAAAPGGPAC